MFIPGNAARSRRRAASSSGGFGVLHVLSGDGTATLSIQAASENTDAAFDAAGDLLAFDETVEAPEPERTMEAMWERYVDHLCISVDTMKQGFDKNAQQIDNNKIKICKLICFLFMESTTYHRHISLGFHKIRHLNFVSWFFIFYSFYDDSLQFFIACTISHRGL